MSDLDALDELHERIRHAEEQLAVQARWSEDAPARVRRRIRGFRAGAVLLALLAFAALLPVGVALGMVARLVVRMLNG